MKTPTEEITLSEELKQLAAETVHETRSHKNLIPLIPFALFVAAVILYVTFIIPLIATAQEGGQAAGELSGRIAGLAVGSVEGGTRGLQQGYHEGKEEGLSAEDTTAEIANRIENNLRENGKLEVMAAKVDLSTFNEQGEKYNALFLLRGNLIFTVDFNELDVSYRNDEIIISVPPVSPDLKIDHRDTTILADVERRFFKGKAEDGFDSFMNSIAEIEARSVEEVDNYDYLKNLAEKHAIQQIREIAEAVTLSNHIKIRVQTK